MYKLSRHKLKENLNHGLGINIGNAADMVTGAAFQTFRSDTARSFIVNLVPEDVKDELGQILLSLTTVVKVINSQKTKVNTDKLRLLTQQTNMKIVETFPWAVISPSVHRILAHAWEVIEENDGYGLEGLSEEGLKALNKNIRHTRTYSARKKSTEQNIKENINDI